MCTCIRSRFAISQIPVIPKSSRVRRKRIFIAYELLHCMCIVYTPPNMNIIVPIIQSRRFLTFSLILNAVIIAFFWLYFSPIAAQQHTTSMLLVRMQMMTRRNFSALNFDYLLILAIFLELLGGETTTTMKIINIFLLLCNVILFCEPNLVQIILLMILCAALVAFFSVGALCFFWVTHNSQFFFIWTMWCWTVWSNLENGKRREARDILHFLSSLSSLRAKSGGGGIGAPRIRRQSRALALECRTKWCNIIYFFALGAPLRVDFFQLSTQNENVKRSQGLSLSLA